MSKPNKRRVKLSEFRRQLAEAVLPPDGMVTVDLDDDGEKSVTFRVPLNVDADDEYPKAIQATESPEDLLQVVLGAEQAQMWTEAGNDAKEFAILFGAESVAASERMRDFRYRPSGR